MKIALVPIMGTSLWLLPRVLLGESEAGVLAATGACLPRGAWIAWALLEVEVAHVGLDGFTRVGADGARSPLCTFAPPALDNRSLFVSPQRHSWASRVDDRFPTLAGGGGGGAADE